MISFSRFISEQNSKFNIEQFIKDCSYALTLMDKRHLLYRGIVNPKSQVSIETWSPRKKPMSTPMLVHQLMNSAFEDMFGAKIRDWLFCTGHQPHAVEYTSDGDDAEVFVIFPIGKFEWVGSLDPMFEDMTRAAGNCMTQAEKELKMDYSTASTESKIKLMYKSVDILKSLLDKSEWNHNTGLKTLLSTENEIMIKCDRYYRISLASPEYKQIMEILK